jgi:Na+/H+-translocating membrane pyrophosphatase
VTAVGIVASALTVPFAYMFKTDVETKLKIQLIVSTLLMSALLIPVVLFVLPNTPLNLSFAESVYPTTQWQAYGCILLGLWSGLFIGLITEYYTSKSYSPT